MFKGRLKGKEGDMLILGVTADNLQRLATGDPIILNFAEVQGSEGLKELFILFGATDEVIASKLRESGIDVHVHVPEYVEPEAVPAPVVAVGIVNNEVAMRFTQAVNSISMTPEAAINIAQALIETVRMYNERTAKGLLH